MTLDEHRLLEAAAQHVMQAQSELDALWLVLKKDEDAAKVGDQLMRQLIKAGETFKQLCRMTSEDGMRLRAGRKNARFGTNC